MKQFLIGLVLILPLSVSAANQTQSQESDAFRQRMFEQRKTGEMASHQERIRILQVADNCIRNAVTPEAFRLCEDAERSSRQAFQAQERVRKEQLRAQLGQFREQNLRPAGSQAVR